MTRRQTHAVYQFHGGAPQPNSHPSRATPGRSAAHEGRLVACMRKLPPACSTPPPRTVRSGIRSITDRQRDGCSAPARLSLHYRLGSQIQCATFGACSARAFNIRSSSRNTASAPSPRPAPSSPSNALAQRRARSTPRRRPHRSRSPTRRHRFGSISSKPSARARATPPPPGRRRHDLAGVVEGGALSAMRLTRIWPGGDQLVRNSVMMMRTGSAAAVPLGRLPARRAVGIAAFWATAHGLRADLQRRVASARVSRSCSSGSPFKADVGA